MYLGKKGLRCFVMVTTGLSGENYFRYILDLLYLYGSESKVCDKKKRSAGRHFSLEWLLRNKVLFYNLNDIALE